MPRPDFLFIGPSKSGSSWFFELLRSHPEVYVPKAKDTYFFDKYYAKGEQWYESFFVGAGTDSVCGEVCHDYLSSREAIERIYKYNPEMKLVCCLREPVDRAISSYKYFQKNGMALGSFEEALEKYPEIYHEGLYNQHLEQVFGLFPKDQVLILFFEDIAQRPSNIAQKLFEFIGVSKGFVSPYIGRVVNKSATARSTLLARIVKEAALLVRRLGFPTIVGALKANPVVHKLLYRENSVSIEDSNIIEPPIEMIEVYSAEIDGVEAALNVDLSHWKKWGVK